MKNQGKLVQFGLYDWTKTMKRIKNVVCLHKRVKITVVPFLHFLAIMPEKSKLVWMILMYLIVENCESSWKGCWKVMGFQILTKATFCFQETALAQQNSLLVTKVGVYHCAGGVMATMTVKMGWMRRAAPSTTAQLASSGVTMDNASVWPRNVMGTLTV